MRRTLVHSLLLCCLLAVTPRAHAVDEVFATRAGAIRGYDAVAYHLEGRAVRGADDITHHWNGATWHFASVAHRDRFAATPDRYAPRYGGYCAYGTANGYKVSTAPEAFAIVDGVLYLNHSVAVQNTWDKDRPTYIGRAEAQWRAIEHDAYASDVATIAAQKRKSGKE